MRDHPLARNYKFRTTPYKHQGFEGALKHWWMDHWGWLLEMGTGKSKVCIDNGCILFEFGEVDCWLIFAPKGVYRNWTDKEIPTHMPEAIREKATIHLWQGGHTVREKDQLEYLCTKRPGGLRILVANVEAISNSKNFAKWVWKFVRSGKVYCAVDEASCIKNPTAIRTKEIIKLGRLCEYTRILTGTPVPKGPLDLWAEFEFLKKACLGFWSYVTFKKRYAIIDKQYKYVPGKDDPIEMDIVVGYQNTEKLSAEIANHANVIRKEDCLDLPPKVYETWDVELTKEQQRIYTEFKQFATAELEAGKFVTATVVIAQLLRMHQIVCGHTTDENGEHHDIPSNRPFELLEIMEGLDNKTIVWCNYRSDMHKVMAALEKKGYAAVRYDGETPGNKRAEAIWRFQGEKFFVPSPEFQKPPAIEADIFVGTPSAGGYGITLTAARNVIYYSNNYDLEKRLQSEDRAHRIGQNFSVTYIDMIARGTIDEKIIAALRRKEQLANIIMDGPARIRDLFS